MPSNFFADDVTFLSQHPPVHPNMHGIAATPKPTPPMPDMQTRAGSAGPQIPPNMMGGPGGMQQPFQAPPPMQGQGQGSAGPVRVSVLVGSVRVDVNGRRER